jgi:hypothetical protein
MSVNMYAYIFKITRQILMRVFLMDKVIQEGGSYVYIMHNTRIEETLLY